jgi:hypothetical protein
MLTMLYSKTTNGFYLREMHGDAIPADAVEITDDEHQTLLDGQSAGKRITADADGRPMLSDPPPPTTDELAARVRRDRARRIVAVQWRVQRYEQQHALGRVPSETAETYAALLVYVQELRDVPQQPGFPATVTWPTEP